MIGFSFSLALNGMHREESRRAFNGVAEGPSGSKAAL